MLRSRRGDCWGLSTWDPITIAKATFDLNLPLTPLKRHSALIIDKPHTYSDTYEHSPSRDNVLKVSDFDLKWRACKIFKPFDLCVGLCWSYRLPHRPGEPPPPSPMDNDVIRATCCNHPENNYKYHHPTFLLAPTDHGPYNIIIIMIIYIYI